MMILGFGWTWPALFATGELQKTVTRRKWINSHAKKFKAGALVSAYNKAPMYGGQKIGIIRIQVVPYKENIKNMPDSDYYAEGFAYLAGPGNHLLPASMPIGVTREGFEEWKKSKQKYWVVRFEVVELDEAFLENYQHKVILEGGNLK